MATADITVVGGGVVGVCVAGELARRGASVVVLERGPELAWGCSAGNAGIVGSSHVLPLADPAAVRDGIRWMLRPDSPFFVRPRPRVLPWLMRFAAAASPPRVRRHREVLHESAAHSAVLHAELAEEGLDTGYRRSGLLNLYRSERAFSQARAALPSPGTGGPYVVDELLAGEAEANRDMQIKVAENLATSEKGQKKAEAEKRIFIEAQEADAVAGENRAKALIAASNAELSVQSAQAAQRSQVAQFDAKTEIQKAQARSELQRLTAEEVVRQQIEKQKITIAADAEAEKTRREAQGQADAILLKYEAEAKGIRQVLEAKAQGYQALVHSTNNDARAVATLLLTEKLEQIVTLQVEAIKAIKIDKITVWDAGNGANGNGGSTTANFLAGMVKSLPPLHDVAAMAGLDLPKFLGDATAPQVPAVTNGHGQ